MSKRTITSDLMHIHLVGLLQCFYTQMGDFDSAQGRHSPVGFDPVSHSHSHTSPFEVGHEGVLQVSQRILR